MSDDERALEHLRHRTPASGVPVHAPDEDDFTPVGVVIERIEHDLGDSLSIREQRIIQALRRSDANQEMRSRARRDTGDTAALARRIDDLETTVVDISGKTGNNGKLGALKERVDKAEARKWWALTFIAGLIVTIIGSAFAFGSRIGALETDVETLKARRARNASPPEYPAARE